MVAYTKMRHTDYMTAGLKLYTNAIPVRMDTWHTCKNFCSYCFARALEFGSLRRMGIKYNAGIGRVTDIPKYDIVKKSIWDSWTGKKSVISDVIGIYHI